MFGRSKWVLACVLVTLAACGSNGLSGKSSSFANSPFHRATPEWKPFSPSQIVFHHVEDNSTAGKNTSTYVDVVDADIFEKIFGNIVIDALGDYTPVLTGDNDTSLRMLNITSRLLRLNSPEDVIEQIEEQSRLSKAQRSGLTTAQIFLFPRLDQFESYISALTSSGRQYYEKKQIAQGCVSLHSKTANNGVYQVILTMAVTDNTVSWADPNDRACLSLFFADNFGVKREAVSDLLPRVENNRDCILVRILNAEQRSSTSYQMARYQSGCPQAPKRRAASILWYAQQHGIGLTAQGAADLSAKIINKCKSWFKENITLDESCSII